MGRVRREGCREQGLGRTHALVLLGQRRQAEFQDAFEEPVASGKKKKDLGVRYSKKRARRFCAPFFEFQECFLAECAQLFFGPSAGIVEHETTRLAIEFLFLEELCDAHGFDRFSGRVSEEEGQTFLLECRNAELM